MTLPPPVSYAEAGERVRCMQALYDCSVSSNGRTRKHNATWKGDEESFHLVSNGCMAWDLIPDDAGMLDALGAAARLLGFQTEPYQEHIHIEVDWR